jgi:hypothetical protein
MPHHHQSDVEQIKKSALKMMAHRRCEQGHQACAIRLAVLP